jgi:hypothetical protein
MVSLKLLASVVLVTGALAAPVLAQDVQYELYNNSALTLMEFYTSPASMDDWGPDILGSGVIAPGEAGTVTIADGSDQCTYDLLFVMEDGQQLSDTVDICSMASYTLQ